jgi:hypothetical protein
MRLIGSALALLLLAAPAYSVVLADKSDAQKHRRDIGKQSTKYVICLVKAVQKCEKNGDEADQECFLASGTVQGGDPNLDQADFQARIAKCDAKLNLAKKSPSDGTDPVGDYETLGCPGDAVAGGSDQRFADLTAYQNGIKSSAKSQIDGLTAVLCIFGCAQSCADDSQANLDCLTNDAKRATTYAKAIQKCQTNCENDYKVPDKKGGGGPTDDNQRCTVSGAGDPDFDLCANKAFTKLQDKASAGTALNLRPQIDTALDNASNDLYNECDCGAGVGPCP